MNRSAVIEKGLSSALSPIDPVKFTKTVEAYLRSVGVLVSDDTPKVIDRLCRLFNFSIGNPKIGGLLNSKNILIYPAQTGTGKSVSIQHYAAMLTKESSLIVVNTVEEASAYCRSINSIRGQQRFARFYATKKVKDPNYLKPKGLFGLHKVQCLVITNKMFRGLHTYTASDVSEFSLYKSDVNATPKPRDLVVIDERISFLCQKNLKFSKLAGVANFLEETLSNSLKLKNNEEVKKQLNSIQAILQVIEEEHSVTPETASLVDCLSIESKLDEKGLPTRIDFQSVMTTVAARLDEINSEVSLLFPSKISNLREIKNETVNTLNTFLNITREHSANEDVTYSAGEEVYREFAIFNKDLFMVKNIYNEFGTTVILDATAEVNRFYELSSNSNSYLDIVPAPKIRSYKNLTIHKAQGYPQSANAIYKKNNEVAKQNGIWYTNVIEEITGEEDRLLVISFKDFIDDQLQKFFKFKENVKFTNWGKHVGRNDWSDCNKVIIIGWLRLPEEDAISKLFNISSLGTSDIRTMKHVTAEKVKELQLSEIADDLVQGAMRCCARIIDTNDSDCRPASIYLFQDVLDGSDEVLDLFQRQFPGATVLDWKIKVKPPFSSLSAPDQKKEKAILHLLELAESHKSYSRSEFCREVDITQGTLNRWLKVGHFKNRLDELGFHIEKPKGKPERFNFAN